jgi:hypothetical protein
MAIMMCIMLIALQGWGAATRITLANGIISYVDEDGQRKRIAVGKKCADLWSAPDGSVIAFIAINKAEADTVEPFIEESTIYIARERDKFKPTPVIVRPTIGDHTWEVGRQPSISRDFKTLFFSVPGTTTSWKLMSTSLPPSAYTFIGDVDSYCVVWGGAHDGDLLLQSRRDTQASRPRQGVTYPCYLRTKAGDLTAVANEGECWNFGEFATRWGREHGGSCQQPWLGTN